MKPRRLMVLVLAVGLLLPQVARTQEIQPITWISFVQAQHGQSQALTQALVKYNSPLYDRLIAEGYVISWGIAQSINHWPDDNWSHVEWVTFPSWAGINKFVEGFVANMMAKSEEQQKAEAEEFEKLVVIGSHFDSVVRHVAFNPGKGGRPAYLNLAFLKARPGEESAVMGLWQDIVAGAMQSAQDEGAIGAYGMYIPEIHGDHSWSHVAWYGMPSLAGRDAIDQAMAAAAQGTDFQSRAESALVPDTHSDRILVVTAYNSGGQEGED